jgi:hypothetical protein
MLKQLPIVVSIYCRTGNRDVDDVCQRGTWSAAAPLAAVSFPKELSPHVAAE